PKARAPQRAVAVRVASCKHDGDPQDAIRLDWRRSDEAIETTPMRQSAKRAGTRPVPVHPVEVNSTVHRRRALSLASLGALAMLAACAGRTHPAGLRPAHVERLYFGRNI